MYRSLTRLAVSSDSAFIYLTRYRRYSNSGGLTAETRLHLPRHFLYLVIIIIIIIIFINCNWVITRWQCLLYMLTNMKMVRTTKDTTVPICYTAYHHCNVLLTFIKRKPALTHPLPNMAHDIFTKPFYTAKHNPEYRLVRK